MTADHTIFYVIILGNCFFIIIIIADCVRCMLHLTVATSLKFALDPLAFKCGYFEVDPSELHNVPNSELLELQLRTKMF
jgi:hypothetical protein